MIFGIGIDVLEFKRVREVYKRFGLDRVVVLRYLDGSGAPSSREQLRGVWMLVRRRVPVGKHPSGWDSNRRRGWLSLE